MFSTLFMLRALTNQKKRFIFGVLFFRLWLFPGGPFQTVGGGGGGRGAFAPIAPPSLRACTSSSNISSSLLDIFTHQTVAFSNRQPLRPLHVDS